MYFINFYWMLDHVYKRAKNKVKHILTSKAQSSDWGGYPQNWSWLAQNLVRGKSQNPSNSCLWLCSTFAKPKQHCPYISMQEILFYQKKKKREREMPKYKKTNGLFFLSLSYLAITLEGKIDPWLDWEEWILKHILGESQIIHMLTENSCNVILVNKFN